MLKSISLVLCGALLSSTAFSSCIGIVNRISMDVRQYQNNLSDQNLPWMSILWLRENLKKSSIETTSDGLTHYKWSCGNDSDVYLSVATNSNGNIVSIEGIYSTHNGSGLFTANLNIANIPTSQAPSPVIENTTNIQAIPIQKDEKNAQSKMPPPLTVQQETPRPVEKLTTESPIVKVVNENQPIPINDPLTKYNKEFGASFNNMNDVQQDMIKRMKNYMSNVRQCKAGTYHYASSSGKEMIFLTTTIEERNSTRCIVDTNFNININDHVEIKCQYRPRSLRIFTNTIAINSARIGNENPPDLQALVPADECQTYMNGQLISRKKH